MKLFNVGYEYGGKAYCTVVSAEDEQSAIERLQRENPLVRVLDAISDQIEAPCSHESVTRLPGVTSTGVKISVCNSCGAQIEEDVS